MCERQQSLMQQAKKEGDGDAVSYSTDTSRWSSSSGQRCGSNSSHYASDYEDRADESPEVKLSDKWRGSKSSVSKKDKKTQGALSRKTSYTASFQSLKLPPIRSTEVSKPRLQSANLNCIRELKSQVRDLQQQLNEARTENKLLKRVQHRHTMALQHFQDSEGSLSQILTKHNNEARVLQGLLRETRSCRDSLARQLQATENKLLSTKSRLQHLQLLSQDHSLLEREELTLKLTQATAELEEKDKRIVDLERNLQLCQASFNRQIAAEQRKINEATKISCFLREQIYQLTRDIQDRERELETHNIYSHRFLKGSSKKGRESKMVQTDGSVLLPTYAESLLELDNTETEKKLGKQESSVNPCCYNLLQFLVTEDPNNPLQESLVTESPNSPLQESLVTENSPLQESVVTENSLLRQSLAIEKSNSTLQQSLAIENPNSTLQQSLVIENPNSPLQETFVTENPNGPLQESLVTENSPLQESLVTENSPLQQSLVTVNPNSTLQETLVIENPNSPLQETLVMENSDTELSANVTLEEIHQENTETCAATSDQSSCSDESLDHQTERDYPDTQEATEAPWVSEEEQKTEEDESEVSYILEKSQITMKPKTKEYKLPKIRRNYTFTQSIENLHSGRPANSSTDLNPSDPLSTGIQGLRLQAGKSKIGGVSSPLRE